MNIFAKLAHDHIMVGGDSPLITGPNDLRPVDPQAPPLTQKSDTQGPLSDFTVEKHRDTMQGELARAFDNYVPSVRDYNSTIGQLMSAKIEEISGSSAASQALARHQR